MEKSYKMQQIDFERQLLVIFNEMSFIVFTKYINLRNKTNE